MSDDLKSKAWTVCCDFHDELHQIQRHLKEWEREYGRTLGGVLIQPPKGWKILPYREIVPPAHREFYEGFGWLRPRSCVSTMTPIFSRPTPIIRAYAVPE